MSQDKPIVVPADNKSPSPLTFQPANLYPSGATNPTVSTVGRSPLLSVIVCGGRLPVPPLASK